MRRKYYAHSLEGQPEERWQLLEEHLNNVALKAQEFASSFNAGEWGYLAGLWHDVGKYSEEFQRMLHEANTPEAENESIRNHVDHSSAGAQLANNTIRNGEKEGGGKLLAYVIAGHHAGLLNASGSRSGTGHLRGRLEKVVPSYCACPPAILQPACLNENREKFNRLPVLNERNVRTAGFKIAFFVKMLFSCLVDADYLDTERVCNPEQYYLRCNIYPELRELEARLASYTERLIRRAAPTIINKKRLEILEACKKTASDSPGFFSLTVPTGGGKTLSSLTFALKHALKHGLKRVIYVIPYTCIIEQNAAVFREALGEEAVLEHHSNYESFEEDRRARLASENWDAPLIVTTNVQFFESLFSVRPSRCRKLHNISESVIVLDEAQMLPVNFLRPCLEVLRELVLNYRVTVVLCTATQPALLANQDFKDGLENVREIIKKPEELYEFFKRVEVKELPDMSVEELGKKLKEYSQVLCVVNNRREARLIYEQIKDGDGAFHLSGLMCPAHRSEVLLKIKEELVRGNTCRLVSTQLIEAGVDISFPVVFRARAGLDSVAQSAGRCNREGLSEELGKVYIFSTGSIPPGYLRQSVNAVNDILRKYKGKDVDLLSPPVIEEYFKQVYWLRGEKLDARKILEQFEEGKRSGDFAFKDIAEQFRLIDDAMESLIIPYDDEARYLIKQLEIGKHTAAILRSLQKYTIQLYPKTMLQLKKIGHVECLHNQFNVLFSSHLYSYEYGLDPEAQYSPEELII